MKTETTVAPVADDTTKQGDKMKTETETETETVVIKELTIKQEVTAILSSNMKSDTAKSTFFHQTLKRIRDCKGDTKKSDAVVTSMIAEINVSKTTDEIQLNAHRVITTARNYQELGVMTKFDLLEYSNIYNLVNTLFNIKTSKNGVIGYQSHPDGEAVEVDALEAFTDVQTIIADVFKSPSLLNITVDEKHIAYNNLMNETLALLRSQYGVKVIKEKKEVDQEAVFTKAFGVYKRTAQLDDLVKLSSQINILIEKMELDLLEQEQKILLDEILNVAQIKHDALQSVESLESLNTAIHNCKMFFEGRDVA